ncbi:MAG: ABC transporter permease [Burkholderiales bacterium]|jgi:ribose transport system permease protein|nr:ABC transporter permease [Burkholderiales bacterium]
MPIFPNLNNSDELKALFYRLFVVIFICIGLSFLSEAFLTVNNLLNVLRQASLLFLMASGLTLVILTAGIDLSVGANVGMSACLAGTVLLATGSTTLGFLTGICCGALIGLANGLLVTLLRLPSFIATYGMLWILHGITYYFMAGATINGFSKSFRMIGSGYWFGIPVPIYMMLFFLISGSIFLRYTIFGQQIYALGANPVTARLSGVPVTRRLLLVYILSGITAGLASLVFLARLNSAEGDIGEALTLPAIAAVLIGGTSLFGGVGTMLGTLIGALILTLVLNGMNILSIDGNLQALVTGVIIIVSVLLDLILRRKSVV